MKKLLFLTGALSACCVLADVRVVRVLPNKINYKEGEKAVVSVVLENNGNVGESAKLVLIDKWDMSKERKIYEEDVSLGCGERKEWKIDWQTGREKYGHEVRAIVVKNGREVASKGEFVNVIDAWWRVNIGIWPWLVSGMENDDKVFEWYGIEKHNPKFERFLFKTVNPDVGPFATYFTNTTPWDRAISTFGAFYDASYKDDEVRLSPGGLPLSWNDFKAETALCAKWGMHRTMFTIQNTIEPAGFEIARKHPEYFIKDFRGDFFHSNPLDPFKLSELHKYYGAGWSFLYPDFTHRPVWKFGADTVIEGLKHNGENGVYFDGPYRVMDGYNYKGEFIKEKFDCKSINRELSMYMEKRLRDFKPDIYYWVNGAMDTDARVMLGKDASGVLWELNNFHQIPEHSYNVWNNTKEEAIIERNKLWYTKYSDEVKTRILHIGYCLYPSGVFYFGSSAQKNIQKTERYKQFVASKGYWCLNAHTAAIIAAVCGHPYGEGSAWRPWAQMMTRYSEFYWGEGIEVMKKAFKKFDVDALRDIWWEDFVYVKETKDYTDYYIHLLNAPDEERHKWSTIEETKFAKGVEVTSSLFKDVSKVKAWTVQPYASDAAILEPVMKEVQIKEVDGDRVFSIDPFRYYTLLVIRETK